MRKNLQAARKEKGLTQQQMAELLDMGIRQYQRIEAGDSIGTFKAWDEMEALFGIHQRVLREIYPDTEANQETHQKNRLSQSE